MSIKILSHISAVIISALPLLAYADVTVINNTNAYATGYVRFSPCSSAAGDRGVVKPHQPLTVSQSVINMFCGSSLCELQVFMTKNCSGKKIASITINSSKGVTSINNFDSSNYVISGSGANISIDPAPKGLRHWFNFFS